MAVLQMQKIHICALKSNRKQILEELQRKGIVQVETDGQEDEIFQKMDTGNTRSAYEKRAQNAEAALKILERYVPENAGLLSSLEGKKVISAEEYYAQVKDQEHVMKTVNRILALEKELAEAKAAQVRAEVALESLVPWMSLDVPMNYKGSRSTAALVGTLPGQWTLEQVQKVIAQAQPELEAYTIEVLGADKDQTCLFGVCAKADLERLEDALRVNGFARPSTLVSQTPAAYAEELEQTRAGHKKAEEEALAQLQTLADQRTQIKFVADYYTMRAEKYGVLGGLLQSKHVFFVNGYIPAKHAEKCKTQLEEKYSCQVEIEEVPEDEAAPVLLKNNGFTAPVEGVVESYGLPGKGEIDPTGVMAFFYYFLFGLMLGDAGYGLIMVIGCAWALKKFPGMESGMKKMLQMFLYCGISTAFWGVMFNSYFGDIIPIVADTFFGKTVTIPALWFVPLDDPMKLLLFSFLFGIIHLFAGLAIKGYMLLRDKQYMDFFCSVVLWYALLIGLILLLLPSDIFASMAGTTIYFPAWLKAVSKWLSIGGAVGIVLMSSRDTKNFGLRIALGAYDLYGASSWLSDVLSYSRLLALGLATGVIASVINTMDAMLAGALGGGILGAIVFAIIFVVGHVLNLAINLLGAYVHTNRLQFVEFFGKFYEGGGKAFTPFSASKTKYIKFKEEN